jgi:hypothetical protein
LPPTLPATAAGRWVKGNDAFLLPLPAGDASEGASFFGAALASSLNDGLEAALETGLEASLSDSLNDSGVSVLAG